jgi:DNA gyrase subunit A
MATTRKKKTGGALGGFGIVRSEDLAAFGTREMQVYADKVNLDRAIPDLVDGLKPVQRRIMWASYNLPRDFVKTARLVGDVIGRYHPHGDVSVSDSITVMIGSNVPPMLGKGNWGSLIDPAAAMRYCFVGSTRVMTEKGLLKFSTLAKRSRIESEDHVPFQIKVDTKAEPAVTSHFVNSGIQETVQVVTESGYSTVCTPNEPFYVLTEDGFRWKQADALKQGDHICLKRGTQMDVKGSHSIDPKIALFLGYMVGDGYMNLGQNTLGFNQVRDDTFADFLDCAATALPKYKDKFLISREQPRGYGKLEYNQWRLNSKAARDSLARYGLVPGDSYTQVVPECVFRGSSEFVSMFLQGLFESDGSIFGKGTPQIVLDSVSDDLLDGVSLLLRSYFGIFANKVWDRTHNRLLISGADNINRYGTSIGFRSSDKYGRLGAVNESALLGKTGGGGIRDCIPFSREFGFGSNDRTRRTNFRHKFNQGLFGSKMARLLFERDYYYERVVSVKDAGEAQVWDLTVPGTHSFVADGFVVHNTNCTLSQYGRTFFGSQYIVKEVTDFIPNYDDTTVEPVTLPSLFPNVLLTGAEGIGVGKGTATTLPSFTPESVAEVMIRLLKGEKLQPQDFATTLKWNHRYGGHMLNTKPNREAWLQMFKTPKARVLFKGKIEIDRENKAIEIDDWPHDLDPVSLVEKIRVMKEKGKGFEHVHRIYNSQGATGVRIEADKGINFAQFDSLVAEVEKRTLVARSFKINVTRRVPVIEDGKVSISTTYEAMSVPQVLVAWLRQRITVEKKSLEYRIVKQNEAIAYSKLLIFVANNADQIIKIIRRSTNPERDLMKAFKFSQLQASQVLDLKLRSISKLDQSKIKEVLAEQVKHLTQLKTWLAKPKAKVIADTQGVLEAIEKDRAFEAAKERKMQVS